MREIAVGIPGRRDTLVHLQHVHAVPRHFLVRQGTQHHPRRVAAAHGHDEAAARRHCDPGVGGDDRGGLVGHRVGIGQHFDLHGCLARMGTHRSPRRRSSERVAGFVPSRPERRQPLRSASHLLASVPRFRARTRRPACPPSAPDRRCATPLPHSPRGRTGWRLPPWRRPARARRHPSRRRRGGGSPAAPPCWPMLLSSGSITVVPSAIVTSGLMRKRK